MVENQKLKIDGLLLKGICGKTAWQALEENRTVRVLMATTKDGRTTRLSWQLEW